MLEQGVASQIARALCLFKLGLIYYETEENSLALTHLTQSLEIWQSCSEEVIACHINTVQDVQNQIGVVLAAREDPKEALVHLAAAEKSYYAFKQDVPPIIDPIVSASVILQGTRDQEQSEQNLTQTYFYYA